jgi:hypothetical protein
MASRYVTHINRIVQQAKKAGPYIYVVGVTGLESRWPRR